jgi:hypothetical protein
MFPNFAKPTALFATCLLAVFLLGLFFYPEDRGDVSVEIVG